MLLMSKPRDTIIPLGTKTPYGSVEAVGMIEGERYYWMIDKKAGVSMIPASVLEQQIDLQQKE